jgi:hypothetical protein
MQTEAVQNISLASVANHGFVDDPAAAVRGWTAEGSGQDLPGFKPGKLDAFGVPFEILDPAAHGGRSVIALRKADKDFVESATVTVGQTCDWIYILNTGIWIEKDAPVGVLTIVYEGDLRVEVEFREARHMAHWHYSSRRATEARRLTLENVASTKEGHAHFYVTPIANPHPGKRVKALTFRAVAAPEHNPIWLILGVTVKTGECAMNPRSVTVSVEPAQPRGVIRRLNGTNLGPPLLFEGIGMDITEDLKPLSIPLIRLHDAPWENGGLKLVDIPQVFPLFHADAADSRNYCFRQTDDYIAKCLETGAKVLYRLGVSIEHTKRKYNTEPPPDFAKWAEICCRIVAHYNEGWADGFRHNIEYWEIWNEADAGPAMWSGTWEDYIRLYVTAAKAIKARFPAVKVGGPAICSANSRERIEAFLDACRRENAPLDFFSWHHYAADAADMASKAALVKSHLDRYGFTKTELHLNEWHYVGGFGNLFKSRGEERRQAEVNGMNGADGAAFTCEALTRFQDTALDMANFYTGTVLIGFGIFDSYAGRTHSYYALLAFARMLACSERLEAHTSCPCAATVLAGRKPDGTLCALVSCCRSSARTIDVDFGIPVKSVNALALDDTRRLVPVEARFENSRVTLAKDGASTVFLVEASG